MHLIWLTDRKKPEPTETLLADALRRVGCESTFVVLPEGAIDGDPLEERIPVSAHALIIVPPGPSEVPELVEALRDFRSTLVPVPVVLLAQNGELEKLSMLFKDVTDEVFSLTGNPAELAFRIRFRKIQITERMEEEKRRSNAMAKSEIALRQREEFLSVCAHDLRSPLGLIQASIGMILKQEGERLPPVQKELLTRSKRQAAHAISLVHDLLDVMALEQGLKPQYQIISLHALLHDFYNDYKFQAEQKNIAFHYDNPISQWRFLGDADLVRQLLQNLIVNALKFTDPGKNIYLRVIPFQGRRRTDPPYPMVVISLKDEGKGIPHSELQKIFDRFSQVKTQHRSEGRGLGLTVAKQISNLHDGNLWVESEEGKGSTFHVLFPHVISQWQMPAPTAENSKKVIIAEPSQKRREEYFSQLQDWGYTVVFANDGVEALTLLYHTGARLLLLTPRLEKLEEIEVANIVKGNASTSSLPILLATEKVEGTDILPYDALLELPFTRQSFEATLKGIRGSSQVSRIKKAA